MDVVLFPDVVSLAIDYIHETYPNIPAVLIADSDWEWNSTLIEISDTGGDGRYKEVYGAVFQEAVITLNVSDPDSERASEVARYLHALFLIWSSIHPDVHRVQSVTKPVYYPNPDPYTPSYQMTLAITVEGLQTTTQEMR